MSNKLHEKKIGNIKNKMLEKPFQVMKDGEEDNSSFLDLEQIAYVCWKHRCKIIWNRWDTFSNI